VVLVDDEQRVDDARDARLVAAVDLAQRVRQPLLGGGVVRPADAEVAGHQLQQHLAKAQDVVGTSGRWTCHAKVVLELICGHCIFLNKGVCSDEHGLQKSSSICGRFTHLMCACRETCHKKASDTNVSYQLQRKTQMVSGTQRVGDLEFAQQHIIAAEESELPTISHHQKTNTCP